MRAIVRADATNRECSVQAEVYHIDYGKLSQELHLHFCPGTMTTHAESINSDLQRGLDRRLRYTQHRTQNIIQQ